MDKTSAVEFANQILSGNLPEALAAIAAQFSSAVNTDEQHQEQETPAIPPQQYQDSVPRYDATSAPLLYDYQLVLLRNVLFSLVPVLHLAPCPERDLFRFGLEVLFRQAPQLASQIHPQIQEAMRARSGTEMGEFIRFVNQ